MNQLRLKDTVEKVKLAALLSRCTRTRRAGRLLKRKQKIKNRCSPKMTRKCKIVETSRGKKWQQQQQQQQPVVVGGSEACMKEQRSSVNTTVTLLDRCPLVYTLLRSDFWWEISLCPLLLSSTASCSICQDIISHFRSL